MSSPVFRTAFAALVLSAGVATHAATPSTFPTSWSDFDLSSTIVLPVPPPPPVRTKVTVVRIERMKVELERPGCGSDAKVHAKQAWSRRAAAGGVVLSSPDGDHVQAIRPAALASPSG